MQKYLVLVRDTQYQSFVVRIIGKSHLYDEQGNWVDTVQEGIIELQTAKKEEINQSLVKLLNPSGKNGH